MMDARSRGGCYAGELNAVMVKDASHGDAERRLGKLGEHGAYMGEARRKVKIGG